ncbi:TrkA-C domain protein [Rippkaea orientalis PCC 8801]|uniref:TrkA-C domain protein n=1 Tax=Rippkaea orientalis (strain PCC 8801 / RF-1) TaxID=41431 RepID=B7JWI9_RIPO1|nr:SLC13 family permease [Rippkaea orientalis]ACK68330.1 TrkA-C domain protein [Rippkaea orientalis PCC 8801]
MTLFLTLGIVVLALIILITEWFPADFTALMVAVILMVVGIVTPEEGLSGVSNPATLTVMAMFILSAGIVRTDATQPIRDVLLKWGGKETGRQILVMGAILGPLSAFMSNTAIVTIFLPIVEDWCRRSRISVSKLLLPLSYITILGGTITVLGTSTNILASGICVQLGYKPLGIFQLTPLGIIAFIIGLFYLSCVAPLLLPERKKPDQDLLAEDYDLKAYLTELVVTPTSSLIGQTIRQSEIQRKFDLDVLELIRNNNHFPQPLADKILKSQDILLVRSTQTELLKLREEKGLDILPDVQFPEETLTLELTSLEEKIAEVMILSNSRLIGSTLKDLRFRQRYNATVLAIRRGEELLRERLGQIPLRFGDLLLVQGPKDSFLGLQTTRELLVLEQRDIESLRPEKAPIAIAIMIGVVIITACHWLPILVSALLGVVLMVLTGCLKPGEIYGTVRWDVIFLLAGLIPLEIAMDKSGGTQWLVEKIVAVGGGLSGYELLLFFYLVTVFLTEIISNNAAVLLMIPLAVKIAQSLSFNPYGFILDVTFAASNSFMTPLGCQTNLIVYAPGGYRFLDFFRVGLPLTLLMAAIAPFLIMMIYGL